MASVEGKVVVVTGASMGIGECLVKQLAKEGAKVVLVARSEDKLREVAAACGAGSALPVVADVTKREDHEKVVKAAVAQFGHIDVWVNNAGRGISKSVLALTDEDFDEMMLINTKSVLYAMQAIFPHFQERKAGHIINVSSLLGRIPFAAMRSAYCAAKHALNSITCSMRLEVAAAGLSDVHVSLVSPGVVATEFGLNAVGGGMDSRQIPGAQPPEEVADVIVDVIKRPRADEYTRPAYRDQIAKYFAAEDVAELEKGPPFTSFPAPAAAAPK